MNAELHGAAREVLAVESLAGRLEGAFLADPVLGRIWRRHTSIVEACRSVSLEDIRVTETDVVLRAYENAATSAETARGIWMASAIKAVLDAPGSAGRMTPDTLARFYDFDETPDARSVPVAEAASLCAQIDAHVAAWRHVPVVAGLRAAADVRAATGGARPAAERLVMMWVDHGLRSGEARAGWILMPARALSDSGFRAWSPGTVKGARDLLAGQERVLSRDIGALALLRRWHDKAREVAATRHGRSCMPDLVEMLTDTPIVTAGAVSQRLGVTGRTGRNLIAAAVENGILAEVTRRQTYRAWATPVLAGAMESRVAGARSLPAAPQDARSQSETEAFAMLDKALAQADDLLDAIGKGRTRPGA